MMEAIAVLYSATMIMLYIIFWKKVEHGHWFFGLFIAMTAAFTVCAVISLSAWEIMIIIFLITTPFIGKFLVLGLIRAARRRLQAKKIPKAVAISYRFPHNHLAVLGMNKLKSYIPPDSPTTKIVSVNWQGIKKGNDERILDNR